MLCCTLEAKQYTVASLPSTSIIGRKNVEWNAPKARFLEDQNPNNSRNTRSGIRRYALISTAPLSKTLTPSQAPDREMSQSNIETQPARFVDPERQRIRAENLRKSTRRFRVLIIGKANAGKTTILQRVCNTKEQPKIFNSQGRKVCVIHIHFAIEWFYWKIDSSELNPTAKVIKNLFVVMSFSTSGSEECTTLTMQWYLTAIQDMSSMILVALKQVVHQSWMVSRASYNAGQQKSVWSNSYMPYGEWLSNDTQMYMNTVCLGTAFQ